MFNVRVCFLLMLATAAAADPSPQISNNGAIRYDVGQPLTPDHVASIDISVLPTGEGLPEGNGTARDGAKVYAAHCAACHGVQGEGRRDFVALVGGRGALSANQPLLTVGSYWPTATTVFDYIRRAMPYNTPGILSTDEVYAVTAWILEKNGILPTRTVLDRRTLSQVRMPNKDGFVPDPRPDVKASASAR